MNRVLLFFLILTVTTGFAQKFTIQGQVTDTLSNAMPSATVMLMNPRDSSLVNFSATDAKGFFAMKNVSKGNYQVKVTFVGFAPAVKDLNGSDFNAPVIDIGRLKLSPVSAELEALVVQGEKAPVTVKRDTIEFNAGSFKTKANANVEDLLKKMPGMDVQSDGTIRAQGEQVQRVTVDGREFFGRDPKLATRNLPADAVEKVQVFDKKSDQATFTGIDDGQREKTINLELKEEKRHGAFGTLMAGAGTNDRFQGKASVNRFSKGRQLSFLGMGNNVNEQGFSLDDYMNFSGGSQQMAGGGGSMRVQVDGNNQNGVPLNFGGRQNGIMTNYAGGINFNQDFSTKTKAGGSYFYNRLDQNITRAIDRINYLPDGNYRFNQVSKQLTTSDNHRVNFSLDHQLDSANSIKFLTNVTYTTLDQNIQSVSRTWNADSTLQNEGARNSISTGSNSVVNSSLLFRHRFPKKGRTFSTTLSFGFNQNNTDGSLQSTNQFYDVNNEKQDIRQTNSQRTDNESYGAQFSYTEPLGNRKYLEFNYALRTNLNQVDREVYDVANGQSTFNDILSNKYNSRYLYSRPGINLRVNRPKYNFAMGVNYQNTQLNGDLVSRATTIDKTFENVLPVARFNYDFSSFKHLRLDYETSMQEPTIQQLQPVVDNSDPLNLSVGNPNLRPGYAHSVRTSFTTFDPGSFVGFFAFVNANYTANAISWSQTVNQNLVRLTMPVNVNDNVVLTSNFSLVFPVKKLKGRFNVGPTASYTKAINLLNGEDNTSRQRTLGGSVRYDYTLGDILTAGVSANLSHQKTEYSFSTQQNQVFLNSTYSADMNLNFLKNYAFTSSFDFYQYHSETTGFDQTIPILNLSLSRFIMKNKVGELKAAVVNALDQSLSASQTASSNYLQQEVTNNLGRYFMISFTYALNKQLNPMGAGPRGGGGMRMMIRN
ncbi:MAG TPA: outer membrane beta-barrel protein [Cyclobacteriaceae bacterium]|nr:outer membrane beta-barrel protein [Cyclobacteriaceae bacterium]